MTIIFDEHTRAIVYCKFCTTGDFMCAVREVDGKVEGEGRLRWYREDTGDPFMDRDEKHWGKLKTGKTYEQLMTSIDDTISALISLSNLTGRGSGEPVYKLERGKDETEESFMLRFRRMPWVHAKEVKKQ